MDEFSFKVCACCGYEREENDYRNPNRCPRCKQRYVFARAGYMRGESYRPNAVLLEARIFYGMLAVVLICCHLLSFVVAGYQGEALIVK
ncbi:hypothetical protein [Vibrio renipiscarius]|uniref:hypothetical protein n=1 Tax=Vibrio renipiscarius TaxID=1461322 RepID=UPI001269A86B|nr:hypothetical protein [Vibrio renipiscarius]